MSIKTFQWNVNAKYTNLYCELDFMTQYFTDMTIDQITILRNKLWVSKKKSLFTKIISCKYCFIKAVVKLSSHFLISLVSIQDFFLNNHLMKFCIKLTSNKLSTKEQPPMATNQLYKPVNQNKSSSRLCLLTESISWQFENYLLPNFPCYIR